MEAEYTCTCGHKWKGAWHDAGGIAVRYADWGMTCCPACLGNSEINWVNYDKWREWFGPGPEGER